MPEYIRSFMKEHGLWSVEVTGLENVIPQLDVLYMTRIQRERFVDPLEYERNKGIYILTRRKLERARKNMLVMHPLPRVDEIALDVDDDPRAAYFEQARYGMFSRMALLADLANQPRQRPEPVEIGTAPGVLQPPLHHPDRPLPAPAGKGQRRGGLLRLLRRGPALTFKCNMPRAEGSSSLRPFFIRIRPASPPTPLAGIPPGRSPPRPKSGA